MKKIDDSQVIKDNTLIAEFMAVYSDEEKRHGDLICPFYGGAGVSWNWQNKDKLIPDLKYHASWEWLMPVAEKCLIGEAEHESLKARGLIDSIYDALTHFDRLRLWGACCDFIRWHNEQTK